MLRAWILLIVVLGSQFFGWWSSVKKGAKAVVQGAKAVIRASKGLVRAVSGLVTQLYKTIREFLERINPLSLLDFLGYLIGIRITKKLRLYVVVLSKQTFQDSKGGDWRVPELAGRAVEHAKDIFYKQAKVRISAEIIEIFSDVPEAALNVGCGSLAWSDDLLEAGGYFRRKQSITSYLWLPFVPSSVTVFVVDEVNGSDTSGCSLGIWADYVTVEAGALVDLKTNRPKRTLAHEVAHACGLLGHVHSWMGWMNYRVNLMYKGDDRIPPAESLTRLQEARIRSSPHCSYL